MSQSSAATRPAQRSPIYGAILIGGILVVLAVVVWSVVVVGGNPDPLAESTSSRVATFDISVLVFREGLESILVLSAITASMTGTQSQHRRPIAVGAGAAIVATLATWLLVAGMIDKLTESVPALDIQAATGLLAIVVLLVVMNWFFHKVYWTGWIAMHTKRKRALLSDAEIATDASTSRRRLLFGLALLGFTSLYREGFEIVLFLQSYRLQLGGAVVLDGVVIGLLLTSMVAVLTFIAHQRLPYKRMLVLTGIMLGVVLLVMVGEQAQEMQLAGWIPTTTLPSLDAVIPSWAGLWFAVFPTLETLGAQLFAAVLVIGSFFLARSSTSRLAGTPTPS